MKISQREVEQKVSEFEQKCRKEGLKVTPQRLAVYRELVKSKEHPSADILWRQVRKSYPNISLDTVNRTLHTLSELGAAFVVEGSGDVKRYDGSMAAHQHFKCTQCRRIYDFNYAPFNSIAIPTELENSFTIMRKAIYLEGVCRFCQKKS